MTAINLSRAAAIPGAISRLEMQWLAQAASQATTIVEVGSWQGRSTRALADHCRGTVYAIDPWAGPTYFESGELHRLRTDVFDRFSIHLRDHLASGHVRAIQSPAATALPVLLAEIGQTVDLVFIDGDHRYAAVASDIALAWPLLKEGGRISGHDYTNRGWPGVKRAVDERFGDAAVTLTRSIWQVTRCH